MTLNFEKNYAKFRDIEESVARLKKFGEMSREDFLADRDGQDIASFRLIIATEAAIDTCLHVSAQLLKTVPEEYTACFHLLAENSLIDIDLAARLAPMVRFRNLLIHRYWHIDYGRIYEIIIGPDLDDLLDFMHQVGRLIDQDRCGCRQSRMFIAEVPYFFLNKSTLTN
jgi:uncharacterized protein YutE (UPF0331/DUF86 family)